MEDPTEIIKAFELYFNLGASRSLVDVEEELGIPFETLKEWRDVYAWDEKIRERTEDLDRAFEAYYKDKTKDIRNRLIEQMEGLLDGMNCSLGLPFAIQDVTDLRALAQAYESLVRANAMAMTRATDPHNEAPTTWADLLKSSGMHSDVNLDKE